MLATLLLGSTKKLASRNDSPKRLACWLLCRLCPGLWLALCGQHHGQLVWQGQEGAGHGCLKQPHLCGQHAGELCGHLMHLSGDTICSRPACNCLLDMAAVSAPHCQDHTVKISTKPRQACSCLLVMGA